MISRSRACIDKRKSLTVMGGEGKQHKNCSTCDAQSTQSIQMTKAETEKWRILQSQLWAWQRLMSNIHLLLEERPKTSTGMQRLLKAGSGARTLRKIFPYPGPHFKHKLTAAHWEKINLKSVVSLQYQNTNPDQLLSTVTHYPPYHPTLMIW